MADLQLAIIINTLSVSSLLVQSTKARSYALSPLPGCKCGIDLLLSTMFLGHRWRSVRWNGTRFFWSRFWDHDEEFCWSRVCWSSRLQLRTVWTRSSWWHFGAQSCQSRGHRIVCYWSFKRHNHFALWSRPSLAGWIWNKFHRRPAPSRSKTRAAVCDDPL